VTPKLKCRMAEKKVFESDFEHPRILSNSLEILDKIETGIVPKAEFAIPGSMMVDSPEKARAAKEILTAMWAAKFPELLIASETEAQ
jgi:hypothetical protein